MTATTEMIIVLTGGMTNDAATVMAAQPISIVTGRGLIVRMAVGLTSRKKATRIAIELPGISGRAENPGLRLADEKLVARRLIGEGIHPVHLDDIPETPTTSFGTTEGHLTTRSR